MPATSPLRKILAALVCALPLLSGGDQAQAGTRTWDGGGADAKWDTLLNWDNDALPANGDTLVFGSAFTSGTTIDLNGNRTLQTLQINALTSFNITNSTLTLNSGDITRSASTAGDQIISSNIALGADGTWLIAGSGSLTVSGVVSGARKVTKSGAGTLILSAANTFSGEFSVTAGTVRLGNDSATGTGNFKIGAATIYADGAARTIANTVSLDQDFTIGGSLDLTFTGDAVLARDITITTDNTGLSTFSGAISGAHKLFKDGAGMLILSGANSQNETYVNAGVLSVRSVGALGNTKKTTVYSGAALEIQGGFAMGNETLDLYGSGIGGGGALRNVSGNNSWGGNITLKSAATIASDSGTFTISGNIINGGFGLTVGGAGNVVENGVVSGTGGLTKDGAGALTLAAVNTYSGASTINGGTVIVNSSSSLGNIAAGLTINAGTLEVATGFSTTRAITLGNAASTIQVDPSQTYTVTTAIGGTGSLNKTGTGTMVLGASNTFTGNTTVSSGTLATNADGALGSTSKVTINTGGTVLLGSTAGNNRISNTAEVALAGGTFNTGGFSETVGKMTLSGNSTLDFGPGSSFLTFDGASSLGSSALTVLNWTGTQGVAGGTDRLIFNNSSFVGGTSTTQIEFNIGGNLYNANFISLGGNSVEAVAGLTPVPEPATIFGAGVLVLALGWRERKRFALLLQKLAARAGLGRARPQACRSGRHRLPHRYALRRRHAGRVVRA